MAQLRNNPAVKVSVDDYRDMFLVFVLTPPDAETERCCHCLASLGVCQCIPGEAAILDGDAAALLNEEYDSYTVIDAEFV